MNYLSFVYVLCSICLLNLKEYDSVNSTTLETLTVISDRYSDEIDNKIIISYENKSECMFNKQDIYNYYLDRNKRVNISHFSDLIGFPYYIERQLKYIC